MSANSFLCKVSSIHEEKVGRIKRVMKPEETIFRLADTFSALSDPTRAKIIFALLSDDLCVCDLANLLGLSLSAISYQLRILRNLRIVSYRKEGKMVFYSLSDSHIEKLFSQGLEHVEEEQKTPAPSVMNTRTKGT